MHPKVKVLIASWLAGRIEIHARKLRRALRDHERSELRRIRAARQRSRGLRLYAAWARKESNSKDYRPLVALKMPAESRHNSSAA
jgi:hypothetical protein